MVTTRADSRTKDETIETIKSKWNIYLIKKNRKGFYAQVMTRNAVRLAKELHNDAIGLTYLHPQFIPCFCFSSIKSMMRYVNLCIAIEEKGGLPEPTFKTDSMLGKLILFTSKIFQFIP